MDHEIGLISIAVEKSVKLSICHEPIISKENFPVLSSNNEIVLSQTPYESVKANTDIEIQLLHNCKVLFIIVKQSFASNYFPAYFRSDTIFKMILILLFLFRQIPLRFL